jgi:Lysophospholipase L1 and related esterases
MVSILPSETVTAKSNHTNAVYVALGDSVPAGYGLSDTKDCYVKLFSDKISKTGYQNTMYNYAVSGATTSDLLTLLQNMPIDNPKALKTLKKARLITINIGGNDVLGPLVSTINDKLQQQFTLLGITNIKNATPSQELALAVFLYTLKLNSSDTEKLQLGIQNFEDKFPKIIELLKTTAPNARIIVSTIYNPIPEAFQFYGTSEIMLKEMNAMVKNYSHQGGYYVADVYSAFLKEQSKGTQILNFNMGQYLHSPISVDIHPNMAGHRLIAKVYQTAFKKIP